MPEVNLGCQASAARGSKLSVTRSEEHTSELQSQSNLVCRLLLEKKKNTRNTYSLKAAVISKYQVSLTAKAMHPLKTTNALAPTLIIHSVSYMLTAIVTAIVSYM